MNIRFDGVAEAIRNLEGVRQVTPQELAAALYVEGELIMTESKQSRVPVDTGTLRASGRVQQPKISGENVTVTLGYGGAASAYALIQHEATWFNHPGQGRAKYLEGPVKARAHVIGRNVARRIKQAWGRFRG